MRQLSLDQSCSESRSIISLRTVIKPLARLSSKFFLVREWCARSDEEHFFCTRRPGDVKNTHPATLVLVSFRRPAKDVVICPWPSETFYPKPLMDRMHSQLLCPLRSTLSRRT